LGHDAHQCLDSLRDRGSVRLLLEIGLHHLSADAPGSGVGHDTFQAVPGFDPDMSGPRLVVLSWHHQQDQAGISARITRLAPGSYLPAPTDCQGDLCFIALADGGKGDDNHLCASSRPEALDQSFQRILRGRVKQPGKVVDVADGLSGEQRVHALGLSR
jgi:hypothetical protein